MITVVSWGVATSVVDAGRTGLAAVGIPRGGACDLGALRLANRLVGNPPDLAGVETSGGLTVRVVRPVMVAVAGAQADLHVDGGPPLGWGVPTVLPAGAVLRVGRVHDGLRTYLAVRGGAVRAGDTGHPGPDPGPPAAAAPAVPHPAPTALTLWPGPRADWFTDDAWHALLSATWQVSTHADRVGVRLDGPMLARRVEAELPSEGMVEGAVQVPPDGRPIVMLADHPTTGGYPVIAVVDPAHVDRAAQLAPGSVVRFTLRR